MTPHSLPQAWQRWWPRRLRHQMLMLLVLVMALAMVALYSVAARRAQDVAVRASQGWAEAVARTAASAGAPSLALKDYAQLEGNLRDIARLPGVLRVDVVDATGLAILSMRAPEQGNLVVRYRPDDVKGPSVSQGTTPSREVKVAGVDAIQVWAAVDPIMPLGSVGVLFSQEAQRKQLLDMQRESLWAIAGVGLLTIAACYAFLTYALKPLQRLSEFSRRLGAEVGLTLTQNGGSKEVADLTDAMNEASLRLEQQLANIRSNEARTNSILGATADAILGMGPDTRITLLNPAVTSVFGLDITEVLGKRLQDLLPELTPERVDELTRDGMLIRSSQARMARLECKAVRTDGTEFPVEVAVSRVETADGVVYTCLVRDVTDQRLLDNMLRLYNRALECATNGVVISDVSRPGQPLFYANPAFETITGYSLGEAIGRNCNFLQGSDTAQPEVAILREAVRKGESAKVVIRNYRKDGTLFFNELSIAPVDGLDGKITHYVGVQSDVTERERARFALAERSARLNAVFDLSPDGFVVFDREHQMVYCNRSFVQMTGWDTLADSADLSMEQFDEHFVELCDPHVGYPRLSKVLDNGGSGSDTLVLMRPERRTLTRVVKLNLDGQGESILYFRDITRESEVDRMKSEFLTTAAHELRTPMVSIFGFAELMLRKPISPERQRDVIETIHRQSALLINMVNELLDLARIEARQGKDFRLEAQRLGDIVNDTVAGMSGQGHTREVKVSAPHADMNLMVDPDKTRQALANVLSNAYKYSPNGGDITLETQFSADGEKKRVGISVTDQGIGMTPEQRGRLFERFYRADPSGNIPGTGLGMCLVKEIMELQGGTVEVESEIGIGTRVTLWFPQPKGQSVQGAAAGEATASLPSPAAEAPAEEDEAPSGWRG
jgi:PAS domain S-box-containing protein